MSRAYSTTTVPIEKSQAEIRALLGRHGATQFAFGEEVDTKGVWWAVVQFTHGAMMVRLRVPYKVDEAAARAKAANARTKTLADFRIELAEQEAKRIWRVIAWNLKARLVAVEEGVESIAEAFLAHVVLPDNRTVYERIAEDNPRLIESG
ncbi:MAG TPA: hypothetical protein VK631_05785 [Solirubrobacteraceae bacterium]|nr:hypothetical protein [Solirubrobacteraceae bacterium]